MSAFWTCNQALNRCSIWSFSSFITQNWFLSNFKQILNGGFAAIETFCHFSERYTFFVVEFSHNLTSLLWSIENRLSTTPFLSRKWYTFVNSSHQSKYSSSCFTFGLKMMLNERFSFLLVFFIKSVQTWTQYGLFRTHFAKYLKMLSLCLIHI